MMKLLEPILISEKFKSIPKMIITQFCRGKSMYQTMVTDGSSQDLSDRVNFQEWFDFLFNQWARVWLFIRIQIYIQQKKSHHRRLIWSFLIRLPLEIRQFATLDMDLRLSLNSASSSKSKTEEQFIRNASNGLKLLQLHPIHQVMKLPTSYQI